MFHSGRDKDEEGSERTKCEDECTFCLTRIMYIWCWALGGEAARARGEVWRDLKADHCVINLSMLILVAN